MRIISKISDWWHWNWEAILFCLVVILLALFVCGLFLLLSYNSPPRTEQIQLLAEGKLVNIHATGSFNIYEIELKFEDGSMLLMTYSFCRNNNLRVGKSYKIWRSSFYGLRCEKK